MRHTDERTASSALRDGGSNPLRRAVEWYCDHDRLRCGDEVTMAADALAHYRADTADGKDALLISRQLGTMRRAEQTDPQRPGRRRRTDGDRGAWPPHRAR